MIEEIYRKKIAAEFELFRKRKIRITTGQKKPIAPEEEASKLEELIKDQPIDKKRIAELYKAHANELRKEVEDGIFREGKKCNNCERFYQDYENNNEILPCPKMVAYAKLLKENERLTEREYNLVRNGQFYCGDFYMPCQDPQEIDEEMKELEEEQMQTINEWEALALLELDDF
ncbi:MAG: hypothetical protein QXD13_02300 [Candidatus Pacearchaeota archaeon]